jgi:type I restriction enzyme R subunit
MDDANQKKENNHLATQDHAAAVRDLVNQTRKSTNTVLCACHQAMAKIGEQFLRVSR